MLRPATPLFILLFAAFALLLLSVLSTPVIKAIPLGSFEDINFGVFGYCEANGTCSSIELGYDPSSLYSSTASATFDLPASTRHTLTSILVLHPVAAFLCLVMLVLSFAAHFHSPAHSVRYLLGVFIVSIFAFLAALLAFLIDVLLFVPHMAWGSYITLAAACLIGLGSIVACAMRRTLVSRKTRKHRIEANAEMSGENFYNRQAQESEAVTTSISVGVTDDSQVGLARMPTVPQIDKKMVGTSEEQIPLTTQTSLPEDSYSQPSIPQNQYPYTDRSGSADPAAMSGAASGPPQPINRPQSGQRDAYGNILPYDRSPPPDGYGARRGPPQDGLTGLNNMPPSQRGRGGGPGYRGGRGGGPGPYAQPGRGGYGPPPGRGRYGPPPGRGGYGPPPGRAGYGPPGRAGYGGPMPPYNGQGRGGYSGYGGYGPQPGRGGYPGPGRGGMGRSPPPGYQYEGAGSLGNRGPSPGPQGEYYANAAVPNGAEPANGPYRHDRSVSSDLPRAESPPPLPDAPIVDPPSQAVEMDASDLPPSRALQLSQQQTGRLSDSDSEIAGLVGLQQGRTSQGLPGQQNEAADQYVPPRANWNVERTASPESQGSRGLRPPIESTEQRPTTSESYVEDVEPRFAEPQVSRQLLHEPTVPHLLVSPSYEDIPEGARSPAESERSTFTSISQRGINPRWNPPPSSMMGGGYGAGPGGPPGPYGPAGHMLSRRPVRDTNEMLLNTNPDFSLPSAGRQAAGGPRAGPNNVGGAGGNSMIPSSAYPAM